MTRKGCLQSAIGSRISTAGFESAPRSSSDSLLSSPGMATHTGHAYGGEGDGDEHSRNSTDAGFSAYENSGEDSLTGFSAEFDTFPLLLAVLITTVNTSVIVLYARKRTLRSVTNSFLVSLAVSDLLAGLVGIPLYIGCSVTMDELLCSPVYLVWRFVSISSVLHLLLISTDRYIAIRYAMRYEAIVTRKVFFALTCVAWISAAFVSVIQLTWLGGISAEQEDEELSEVEVKAEVIYDLCVLAIFFVAPLIAMTYIYVRIFITVRYHERQIRRLQRPSDSEYVSETKQDSSRGAQRKTATVFLAMLLVFIACWFPYFILNLIKSLAEYLAELPVWVEYVFFYYARFMTSLTNPVLYILGKRDFREALIRTFVRKSEPPTSRSSTLLTGLFSIDQSNSKKDRADV